MSSSELQNRKVVIIGTPNTSMIATKLLQSKEIVVVDPSRADLRDVIEHQIKDVESLMPHPLPIVRESRRERRARQRRNK
jgi:predicted GTPase